MYYSDELVEEVRRRNDIVDVISGYVKLKKSGSNYMGLCPFHNEKSPSFSVSAHKQICHCFGCGKGGNVFSFVMEYEGYSFPEAVSMLAQRVGMALPEQEMSEGAKREQSLRNKLFEIQKEAAKYYYSLLRTDSGNIGRKYFEGRQLSKETMQSFGLGFASPSGGLYQYLRNQKYEDAILKESGLFTMDEKHGMRDKFWNRVIFPIMDVNNRVIGFGGRVMGDGKPKYLNSPETKIFDKGRNLYGLNVARNSKCGHIIMCEGYMDVISMHQAGFKQAVASLGTAMTSGHASLLKRYTKDILLIYDSDEAGVKAAIRAIDICKDSGLSSRVVNLNPYKDPDEFIKNLGAEEFQKRLDNAENSVFFKLRMDEKNYNMSDPDGRTRFLEAAAVYVSLMESEVERDTYIKSIASKYMTDTEAFRKTVARTAARNEGISENVRPRAGVAMAKTKSEDGNSKAQRLLLTYLIDNPEIFEQVEKYVDPECFQEGVNRKVAAALYEQLKVNKLNPASIISMFEDEADHTAVSLLFNSRFGEVESKSDKEKYITDLVVKIKTEYISHQGDLGADPLKVAREQRALKEKLKNIRIVLG